MTHISESHGSTPDAVAETAGPFMPTSFTVFDGSRRLGTGGLLAMALCLKRQREAAPQAPLLMFDDSTGRTIDIDTRGTEDEVLARLTSAGLAGVGAQPGEEPQEAPLPVTESRGRGRPKLGVVPREVTLLPRHWDWLAAQPGGASVALRKLVETARRAQGAQAQQRQAQERAYVFLQTLAGDLSGFEEAMRALFAGNAAGLRECVAAWPQDVREHGLWLAGMR